MVVLADAMDHRKLPCLKELYLSKNTLSDRLEFLTLLAGEKYVSYPVLEVLNLDGTQLQQCDIQNLSQAICKRKLPKLKNLNLGSKNLANSITNLMGELVHPSFSSLEELHLPSTHLNKADLPHLSRVMSNPNMVNCTKLNLSGNKIA